VKHYPYNYFNMERFPQATPTVEKEKPNLEVEALTFVAKAAKERWEAELKKAGLTEEHAQLFRNALADMKDPTAVDVAAGQEGLMSSYRYKVLEHITGPRVNTVLRALEQEEKSGKRAEGVTEEERKLWDLYQLLLQDSRTV
jgi:hypothetical protein